MVLSPPHYFNLSQTPSWDAWNAVPLLPLPVYLYNIPSRQADDRAKTVRIAARCRMSTG